MALFENYKAKFEAAQQEILQLKEHESALRIKLLETEHAIKDVVSEKEQLQVDYNKLYNLLDCDEGELKSARQIVSSIKKECEELENQKAKRNEELSVLNSKIKQILS